ncbi:hypothetical protein SAMN04488505_10740 [Chitinophaga rupis]|uniref:3-keto-disaccharide hydrolase domain-containing protein n=1 Tax=Chitinophaga rupis TaxID=573321 RepID=A0A1H8C9I7_9BACT|nr:hypothetical protein [Chitinophaga rupis]SEM91723.1 hypothetical protein SAMN04488505_10740 [Chitinophaga rupis]
MKKTYLSACMLLLCCGFATGQTVKVPFTSDQWISRQADMVQETYMGRESIFLKAGDIYLKDVGFLDGTIEYDINFPKERNFPGCYFRMQDTAELEIFYVRPHQSGNPDATQYTPFFNGEAGWQLYHGKGYSEAFDLKFDFWHHVKIDVHGLQAEIYIDDMQTPLMKVTELKRAPKAGGIGLSSGGAPVHYANLQYTLRPAVASSPAPIPANGTGGLITRWQVSNVVSSSLFEKKYQLTPAIKQGLTWTTQQTEPSGIINFSRFGRLTKTENAVVARISIESGLEQTKTLSFGFSDFVTVYLNGQALYAGADPFMSRDYRFLGSIGFFDKVFLPLKKGTNELWFVVAENFGGWGLQAKFDDMEKISLK